MTSTILVPGECGMLLEQRWHVSGFGWLIGGERYG